MLSKIFDKTYPGLEKALDLHWKRNEAISSNIANAETPMYRAVDVDFAKELERAFGDKSSSNLMKTSSRHMELSSNSGSRFVPDLSGQTKADGNNVDLDIQMGKLAYNSGKYSIAANLVRKKLQILRDTIREAMR
jgi:flagellar basal-body rod protein FlgB